MSSASCRGTFEGKGVILVYTVRLPIACDGAESLREQASRVRAVKVVAALTQETRDRVDRRTKRMRPMLGVIDRYMGEMRRLHFNAPSSRPAGGRSHLAYAV